MKLAWEVKDINSEMDCQKCWKNHIRDNCYTHFSSFLQQGKVSNAWYELKDTRYSNTSIIFVLTVESPGGPIFFCLAVNLN